MTSTSPDKHRGETLQDLLSALVSSREATRSTDDSDPTADTASLNSGSSDEDTTTPDSKDVDTEKPKAPKKVSDFDTICHYLQQEDWNFMPKPERGIIHSSGTGSNGSYPIVIDLKQDSCILLVYVYMPCKVPLNKRLEIAEYITRANQGVMVGNFELDFDDGECRFKGSTCYDGGSLVGRMVEDVIQRSAYTMNRYFPGMMKVIYGNVDPKQSIGEIEPSQSRGDAGAVLAELLVQSMGGEGGSATEENGDQSTAEVPVAVATPSP